MKKIFRLFLILIFSISLVACTFDEESSTHSNNGNLNTENNDNFETLVCIKSTTEDGFQANETIEIKYKNNNLNVIQSNTIIETNNEYADIFVESVQAETQEINNYSGFTYDVSKISESEINCLLLIEYDKINPEDFDNIDEYFDEDYKEMKQLTIKEIENEMIKDNYSCN